MRERPILEHLRAINACNQRGGRMLSLIDLLEAESVDLPLAAYLAAMMRAGHSLLVGAQPGGAGKTTVMCALLNFVPDETTLQAVENLHVLSQARRSPVGRTCYVAHEISPATYYYAYLWGEAARRFFSLASQGYMIASNLHADTLSETHEQLLGENAVRAEDLNAVSLKIYLDVRRRGGWSMQRWIRAVYEHDGRADRLIWQGEAPGRFVRRGESHCIARAEEERYAELLNRLQREGVRRIEDVRRWLVGASPARADS
ncbi:MAG: hypothetical protein ACP5HM_15815 [Anaerolineae bacterium]